jgi:hypothetical protein
LKNTKTGETKIFPDDVNGDTSPTKPWIRIKASLPPREAAEALYHELLHLHFGNTGTADEEVRVRVDVEKWLIGQGGDIQSYGTPDYRNPDGTVNEEGIRLHVMSIDLYNPDAPPRPDRDTDWVEAEKGRVHYQNPKRQFKLNAK